MSSEGFYSYNNNVETRHLNDTNKNCVCRVEQYLNIQRTFAPPESVVKLEKFLGGMVDKLELVKKDNIVVFQNLMSLAQTNLFNGPKRVRVDLRNSSFRATFGSLHYMIGNIEMDAKVSLSIKKKNEKPYPLFKGTGSVYLEPHPGNSNFLFVPVNGKVRIDKEIFVACEGSLKMDTVWVKGLGAKLLGGEGLTEHEFTGKGWVLLKLPVPPSEVQKFMLRAGQRLTVDGNFVILRHGNIKFSVKTMGKGLSKLFNTTGEGVVNTYEGEGAVWLCPTLGHVKTSAFTL